MASIPTAMSLFAQGDATKEALQGDSLLPVYVHRYTTTSTSEKFIERLLVVLVYLLQVAGKEQR